MGSVGRICACVESGNEGRAAYFQSPDSNVVSKKRAADYRFAKPVVAPVANIRGSAGAPARSSQHQNTVIAKSACKHAGSTTVGERRAGDAIDIVGEPSAGKEFLVALINRVVVAHENRPESLSRRYCALTIRRNGQRYRKMRPRFSEFAQRAGCLATSTPGPPAGQSHSIFSSSTAFLS